MGYKRTFLKIIFIQIFLFLLGQHGSKIANASPHYAECDWNGPSNGYVNYGDFESSRGITITIDNIEPQGVVVVGQDKNRLGVSFHIRIESQPGTIQYEIPKEVCGGGKDYEKSYDDGTSCGYLDRPEGGVWLYWHTVCEKVTEEVYRSIENVMVWLEPDDTTLDLYYGPEDKRLPYIYPSYWKDFELEIIDLGIPDTSISLSALPYLEAVGAIDWTQFKGMPVLFPGIRPQTYFSLWVFNDYLLYFCAAPMDIPPPNGCNPDRGWGTKPGQKPELTYTYDITPIQLPIELPGIWNIAVWVVLGPAYYGPEQKPESLDPNNPDDDLIRFPTDTEIKANYFESHAIISSPCNPAEESGCTDR